ncbi:hypothetical protein [Nonomuraea jabiensis]|uniref:hypothetical protein n=1 Tax=Nonomuraea jabiensis TaxID=882448 RepID=UPI003D705947
MGYGTKAPAAFTTLGCGILLLRLCLTQRQDSRPSPSALVVRRLIRDRAGELVS